MQAVRRRIEEREQQVAAHPFYAWIRGADSPWERRFDFAPVLVNFIMGFADMNRWFMRYPDPTDELRRAINHHTLEDEQHSALFVEDWRKLGLDERLGWTAGDTLAWYHASPETEPMRRDAQWILRMLVENEDPLLRFALMESVESWGHVVFGATAEAAVALTRRSGQEYRYFGPHHLERELGTLIDGDELFDAVVLDPPRRRRALALVDGLFDLAERESDHLLRVVREADAGRPPAPPAGDTRRLPTAVAPPGAGVAASSGGRGAPSRSTPSAGSQRLLDLLDEHRCAAAEHPLVSWMAAPGDPTDKLRRLALFWAPDCLGYRDLSLHVMAYAAPDGPSERAVTRWATALASHHRLFLRDWAALGMDEYVGFTASDTLEYYCRSPHSEAQRRSAATFVTLAHRHPDPVSRFWLLAALQASGEPFFAATRELAWRVEEARGVRLDYLADRHEEAEVPGPPDPEADAVDFLALEPSPAAEEVAATMIRAVFERLDAQMTASLEETDTDQRLAG